jgi:hypothetical protein
MIVLTRALCSFELLITTLNFSALNRQTSSSIKPFFLTKFPFIILRTQYFFSPHSTRTLRLLQISNPMPAPCMIHETSKLFLQIRSTFYLLELATQTFTLQAVEGKFSQTCDHNSFPTDRGAVVLLA